MWIEWLDKVCLEANIRKEVGINDKGILRYM